MYRKIPILTTRKRNGSVAKSVAYKGTCSCNTWSKNGTVSSIGKAWIEHSREECPRGRKQEGEDPEADSGTD